MLLQDCEKSKPFEHVGGGGAEPPPVPFGTIGPDPGDIGAELASMTTPQAISTAIMIARISAASDDADEANWGGDRDSGVVTQVEGARRGEGRAARERHILYRDPGHQIGRASC